MRLYCCNDTGSFISSGGDWEKLRSDLNSFSDWGGIIASTAGAAMTQEYENSFFTFENGLFFSIQNNNDPTRVYVQSGNFFTSNPKLIFDRNTKNTSFNYYFECEIGNAMMKGIANESISLDSYKTNMGASFKYRF